MRRSVWLVVLCFGCSSSDGPPAHTDPNALLKTLTALAGLGNKHVGSDAGAQAGAYLQQRFTALGLSDVRLEPFDFPRWQLSSATFGVTIAGAAQSPGFDVFEASGSGHVDAPVVWCNTAKDEDLVGVDLAGKVALVVRDPNFHRSAQYRNVSDKGALAMLYLSIAPTNLRQVGSVRFDWETMGGIPAVTIGADDGATIQNAVMAGQAVTAQIDVAVSSTKAVGNNVIGVIRGREPSTIVIGAHYDTWFTGSTDNGSGVAELLALADRRRREGQPRYTILFVAYDGEEVALYGGYDFLRRHKIVAQEPILAVINFETPSAKDPTLLGLGHSNQPALDTALQGAGLGFLYTLYAGLELVAELLGGIIPTDIQGTYRNGVPTVSTAVNGPYYHTSEDTPDKVDLPFLADSTDGFDAALTALLKQDPSAFAVVDPTVWTAPLDVADDGASYTISATVRDGSGVPQPNALARATLLTDDFFFSAQATQMSDADGKVAIKLPIPAGQPPRQYIHFGAGQTYPLTEQFWAKP